MIFNRRSVLIILLAGLYLLMFSAIVLADVDLKVTTEKDVLKPFEETKIKIEAVNEKGELVDSDLQLMVRVSRGGLLESEYLKKGITLRGGIAEFTYIAPENPGETAIILVDLMTNLSKRVSFRVEKEQNSHNWKEEVGHLSGLKGTVLIKRAAKENWDTARKGLKMYQGDFIKTWTKSWVTLTLFDDSEIIIEPGTELRIESLKSDKTDQGVIEQVFHLVEGTVFSNVKKLVNKGSRFRIETESSAAGVRGTSFEFTYTINQGSRLAVYEGSVYLWKKATDSVLIVNAGESVYSSVDGDEEPGVFKNDKSKDERRSEIEAEMTGENTSQDQNDSETGQVEISPSWESNVQPR